MFSSCLAIEVFQQYDAAFRPASALSTSQVRPRKRDQTINVGEIFRGIAHLPSKQRSALADPKKHLTYLTRGISP